MRASLGVAGNQISGQISRPQSAAETDSTAVCQRQTSRSATDSGINVTVDSRTVEVNRLCKRVNVNTITFGFSKVEITNAHPLS